MLNIKYKTIDNDKWITVKSFDEISNDAIEIDCSYNDLTYLPEFNNLINLSTINCSSNKLRYLPEFNNLINLTAIYCPDNYLTYLPEFNNLINLKIIGCSLNMLTYLPEWKQLINLSTIYCSHNNLTYLPEFNNLINLKTINCSLNKLTYLPEWQQLTNLEKIYCCYNNLTYLPEWNNLIRLKEIWTTYNNLISLPIAWSRLPNLQLIYYYNNPIEYIPPNLQRIINKQNFGQNIYNDNQNIHNHNIQLSMHKSIEYLIKDKPTISIDQMKQEIKNECLSFQLLIDYCKDQSVHTILNVTFEEVLNSVWSKIRDNINKQEIIKILNIEMLDSECKCFTGRLTRLVNCMTGFDDNIIIQISDNEQMSNISRILYNKYINNIEDYQRELRKEFEERGYSEEDIQIWSTIE
jgi:hypothetical protein